MSDESEKPADAPTRAGFAALIGEPNAGKSTLLNQLVGAKVSIATRKAQTTRARIRGVAIYGASQIVFVDTPGLFAPRRGLDRAMVAAAWAGARDADLAVLLVEAHRGITDGLGQILEQFGGCLRDTPLTLVVNKIDRAPREKLLELTAEITSRVEFERVFMISATQGDGVADLKAWIAERLPEGPWLYPEDDISDLPLRMLAAEITREKLIDQLHEELPYQLTVETENWRDRKNGSARIEQVIYVARNGHKGIVLGAKGRTIKQIGQRAREDIAKLIERPAHLFLRVVVRPDWANDPERYRMIGLDPKDRLK